MEEKLRAVMTPGVWRAIDPLASEVGVDPDVANKVLSRMEDVERGYFVRKGKTIPCYQLIDKPRDVIVF